MANDIVTFNAIVNDIGNKIVKLAELGQDGFHIPAVTTLDELGKIVGLPTRSRRSLLSSNLVWFQALKTTVYARQMLEQSSRIFKQIEDEEAAQKAQNIINTFDEQFHPGETAFQVYSRILQQRQVSPNGAQNGKLIQG